MSYLPSFDITSSMVNLIAETIELSSAFDINPELVPSPKIRRANQIRSVHSSTWIEGNTLTLDEVTAVINGRRVVAPEQEIIEVKHAFDAYEAVGKMDPYSLDDLLKAHGIMMAGLTKEAGQLRDVEVGVYSGLRLIHAGTPSAELPQAMEELFSWLKRSTDHPLIKGCFFHCAFEGIHPFTDGNGRTGRLWHSLINRAWKPSMAWVPIESMVADNQQEYYRVLRRSNEGDATSFIEFMLEMTRDALMGVIIRAEEGDLSSTFLDKGGDVGENSTHVGENSTDVGENVGESPANVGENLSEYVVNLLIKEDRLSATAIAKRLGVSSRQVERILASLKNSGRIERVGPARGGHWKVIR